MMQTISNYTGLDNLDEFLAKVKTVRKILKFQIVNRDQKSFNK